VTTVDLEVAGATEERLKRVGALLDGHFQLTSGLHSNRYVQCAKLLSHPVEAEAVSRALADRFSDVKVDIVLGPALGGIIVGHEVARALGTPCLFTERKGGEMLLRRGFEIPKGARVLVVEDVVTTGGSVNEVLALVRDAGGEVVGVGSIVQRAPSSPFDVRYESLLALQVNAWEPGECPLCAEGTPAVKPGSRQGS
jgi:orotate phosphoribosyltransferase